MFNLKSDELVDQPKHGNGAEIRRHKFNYICCACIR